MIYPEEQDHNPTLYLTDKDFPAIKKYDVGDTYSAIIKCKMIEKRDSHGKISGDFEILSIKPETKKADKVKKLMGDY